MIDTLAAAAALLLAVSGAAKVRHPGPAAAMLVRLLHRPARDRAGAALLVRGTGLGELAVGLALVVTGSRVAAVLLAAAYAGFAAVAVLLLRTGAGRTSCGCFGAADSPIGPAHLVLTAAGAAAGVAAAIHPSGAGLFHGGHLVVVTGWAQAVLLAALGYLAVTALPALLAARRPLVAAPADPH